MPHSPAISSWTEDQLLDGRVRLRQPRLGLRAGIDAVLLAAAIPAEPGQYVLEAGCGTGAVFLCLASRVPDLGVIAVERQPELVALAHENLGANGLAGHATIHCADIRDCALATSLPPVRHAFANPPYWPSGTRPPHGLRATATHEDADLGAWTGFLAAPLVRGGSLTLIMPAARLAEALEAVARVGCGSLRVVPLWPRAGVAAKRVILQGFKGKRGPTRMEAGLVLHDGAGFSAAAAAILRNAAAL